MGGTVGWQVGRTGGWQVGRTGGWQVGRTGGWQVGRTVCLVRQSPSWFGKWSVQSSVGRVTAAVARTTRLRVNFVASFCLLAVPLPKFALQQSDVCRKKVEFMFNLILID